MEGSISFCLKTATEIARFILESDTSLKKAETLAPLQCANARVRRARNRRSPVGTGNSDRPRRRTPSCIRTVWNGFVSLDELARQTSAPPREIDSIGGNARFASGYRVPAPD